MAHRQITEMAEEISNRLLRYMSNYQSQLQLPELQDGSTYAEYTSGVLSAKVIALSTAVHVVSEVLEEYRSRPADRA